ncbi:DUF2332 domain-containing protein [Pedococcus bigeumensis]|uniref:DUF2332 domain-containing protein n=1 Tax=Pedococcus bigeumensis TaxID=433644 RepID=A0A502CX66_9MICO|nr:DUF2332 domain-containing protein [Pedococcus bigeumensis]TPG17254.1 DUF2332 domain-containing protein [Pedococcus bigeumensis]
MAERSRDAAVREQYLAFARGQAAGVSPSYEALALAVAEDTSVSALLAGLPRGKQQPNLLFGVARHLGGPVSSPVEFCAWVVEQWEDVRPELLARTTQTNEAGRCATLLPVLAGMPGPLALLEVGASAGLCLYPDRYRYDYGRGVVGDDDGPVLDCAWRRPEPPPSALPEVVWRAGLDLNPLDVTDEDDLHWLECLIWPEQAVRRDRLRRAAAVARAEPPLLVMGDLVTDLPGLAARAPADATLVVFHTAVLGYVDPDGRRRFADVVRELPGHWIANEHPSLLEGLVVVPPTRPRRDGPEPFLTALDGIPVGWSGPHGQSCD